MWMAALAVGIATCLSGAGSTRPIEFDDVPGGLRSLIEPPISSAAQFERVRTEIGVAMAERVRGGEREALAYFILQSGSFTLRPKIEPAASARIFAEGSEQIPADVRARIGDFLEAVKRPTADARLQWFASRHPSEEECVAAYQQAANFLYPKGTRRVEFYQTRGLSTDTRLEANTAVLAALDAIRAKDPAARLNRVLIVGPGLEFAPRSGLRDLPPQTFQPYVLLDGLLRRKMAAADRVAMECVDINPQVIRFIQEFPHRRPPLLLMPGALAEPSAIGAWRGEALEIRPDLAARVTAGEMNIITERYDPSPAYDLVVATNVLIYFNATELALALANIHAMLRHGGWLVHNENRREIDRYAGALDLPVVEMKTVTLAQNGRGIATDVYVLHEKR
jgi:hypothetical protein